eukprot:SAG11_NODE_773_length_7236_cov_4.526412_6_plen_212_part_00
MLGLSTVGCLVVGSLLAPSLVGVAAGAAPPHLRFMSAYSGLNAEMKGWINLGVEDAAGSAATYPVGPGNVGALRAWSQLGIPSLFGDVDITVFAPGTGKGVPSSPLTLAPAWRQAVTDMVTKKIRPHFGEGKALRGVFLGDELCCHNTSCWDTVLEPLAAEFRSQLGPNALLATNECGDPLSLANITRVPPDLDLISVDICKRLLLLNLIA